MPKLSTLCVPFLFLSLQLAWSLLSCGCAGSAATPAKTEGSDPKAFSAAEYDRVQSGLISINLGQILLQRTHPTGKFVRAQPARLILSADRREITGKVTAHWLGGVTDANYETDFTIEIRKDKVRLTVDRDLAVIQIKPENLRLAELDLANVLQPLY